MKNIFNDKQVLDDGVDNLKRVINEVASCNEKNKVSVLLDLGRVISGLSMKMLFDGNVDKRYTVNHVVFSIDDENFLAFDITLDLFCQSNNGLFEIKATVADRASAGKAYEGGRLDIDGNFYENY